MTRQRLPRSFFDRDSRTVARELLGMTLVRDLADGTRLSGRIVEAEAYREGDAGSHSFRGMTRRNAPMFGPPGHWYVYFTYGMHWCSNVVTEREGFGAAVLLRAVEPIDGFDVMRQNRDNGQRRLRDVDVCRGPANLSKAFQLDGGLSGCDMMQASVVAYIVEGEPVPDDQVKITPRIGITRDEIAVRALWRWTVAHNRFVSGPRQQTA